MLVDCWVFVAVESRLIQYAHQVYPASACLDNDNGLLNMSLIDNKEAGQKLHDVAPKVKDAMIVEVLVEGLFISAMPKPNLSPK